MSITARLTALGAAGLFVTGMLASAGSAGAAPAPRPATPGAGSGAPAHPAQGPGKGDSDGDRIADDLQAVLARAAAGDRVEVLVQGTSPAQARRAAPSLRTEQVYRIIPGFSGSLVAGQVRALAHVPGVTRVELDGVARALDASGNQDYGVAAARTALTPTDGSLDGSGVGICIIDTGIDPNHEQLANHVIGWRDWVNGRSTPYDDHGHGTHVAGIATGTPTGAANAAYGGVAPGAKIVSAKVLDANGSGADANVVAAIDWCTTIPQVRVISMSLGSPPSDGSDAGSQAVNAAFAAGKVVVVAAGNSGDAPGTIQSPGVATDAVTVGAGSDPSSLAGVNDTDTSLYLAGFSSRGPTKNTAAPHKPDVVAPGLSVLAAQANTAASYVAMSGTSMATPFVAGVVALGLEAVPTATPATVKAALRSAAKDAGATGVDDEWGAGLVDARAFLAALGAAPAGTAPWPDRTLVTGSVASGGVQSFPISVTTAGRPLGVTLQTTNGAATCVLPLGGSCLYGYEWAPDLDAYLVNPGGTVVAMSRCMLESTDGNCAAPGRFETVGVASAAAGTWQLRVESFSGSGSFRADVFGALGSVAPPPPPTAPSALTVTATSSSSVSLAWTDNSSDETGFAVDRCQGGSCTPSTQVGTVGANVKTFTDSGLTASTAYSYQVRALRNSETSAPSNTASVTTSAAVTPPAAPTGLSATGTSSTSISLAWLDNSSNEDGFRLERCTGQSCSSFAWVANLAAGTQGYVDQGLPAGTTFGYRVRAYNTGGDSAWSPVAYGATSASSTAPSAPTGLTAKAVSATRVDLGWTDTSSNESGFAVERCTGSKCTTFASIAILGANVTSFSDTGLSASTSYRYRVRAFNGSIYSAYSSIVTVKTLRR